MGSSATPPTLRSDPPLGARVAAFRLAPTLDDHGSSAENHPPPTSTPSSRTKKCPLSPSPLHLSGRSPSGFPLQELLLMSPSPHRRPMSRTTAEDCPDLVAAEGPRRKSKGRSASTATAVGLMGCASPRNVRRARRRLEKEIIREEREVVPFEEDVGRVRKRRQGRSRASHKEKLSLGSSLPSPTPLPPPPSGPSPTPRDPEIHNDGGIRISMDSLGEKTLELIMWKNVAKSTLWFGLGTIFIFSSSFSREFSFSIISVLSHLGILILALSFLSDSCSQRRQLKWSGDFQLTEESIVRVARIVLPVANAALTKARELFSGDPSMTLKVALILVFAAKYGHLITLWRLFTTAFFLSFTVPKLYSCNSQQIHGRVENAKNYFCDTWKTCQHKRFIALSTATLLWNMFSMKTRIFAAFISLVALRYHHQQYKVEEGAQLMEEEQQQAMVVAE